MDIGTMINQSLKTHQNFLKVMMMQIKFGNHNTLLQSLLLQQTLSLMMS